MAKISDLSGDERAKRVAELKAKMQASAKERQAAEAAAEEVDEAASSVADSAANAPAAQAAEQPAVEAVATVEAVSEVESGREEGAAAEMAEADEEMSNSAGDDAAPATVATDGASTNGASAAAATAPIIQEKSDEERLKGEMNRREFITYAWGASLGMLALGGGVVSYLFMYPRFRAGEFGGAFYMGPESSVPPADAAPVGVSDGKFWWVNVEDEGPRAIYMVCTHLGCLYKWVGENNRFECPCHGSKFTREGDYIEGPAPRSLDQFVTALEGDEWVVDTGAKINGAPAAESPAAGTG